MVGLTAVESRAGWMASRPRTHNERTAAEAKISGRSVAKSLQTYRFPRSPARSASWQQGPRQRAVFTSRGWRARHDDLSVQAPGCQVWSVGVVGREGPGPARNVDRGVERRRRWPVIRVGGGPSGPSAQRLAGAVSVLLRGIAARRAPMLISVRDRRAAGRRHDGDGVFPGGEERAAARSFRAVHADVAAAACGEPAAAHR
jgi:hypothetical protein